MLIPDTVLPVHSGDRPIRFSRAVSSRQAGARVPVVERRSALGDQAFASIECAATITRNRGHVPQTTDRLALTRAQRAAAARDVRSAGTVSPVPKSVSSGVCCAELPSP
jgi:hypothetical protein